MWDIGRGDDALIKFARGGKETLLHREMESMAHLISPFEADMLNRVTEGLVRTLRILEKDVQRRRAGRLRYLDSYLPRFLRGYYYLYCAARNSSAALPDRAAIPETAYEVSLNSTVSDQRVATWLDNPQQALRVRLSALELSYQLHQWQHGELEAAGNARAPSGPGNKVEEAFTLFVRAYFNRMPPPVPPANGKHL
jgi:hypothetical protein